MWNKALKSTEHACFDWVSKPSLILDNCSGSWGVGGSLGYSSERVKQHQKHLKQELKGSTHLRLYFKIEENCLHPAIKTKRQNKTKVCTTVIVFFDTTLATRLKSKSKLTFTPAPLPGSHVVSDFSPCRESTSQPIVLPVMLTGHIRSYWKWNRLKFRCCSFVSVVISV